MVSISGRLRGAWNAFTNNDDDPFTPQPAMGYYAGMTGARPDRIRLRINNERSIIASIYARLSIDVAAVVLRHTRHDDSDRYLEDIPSGLDNCLTVEANLDQAARAFRQDIVLTLCDKGVAAIVAVDTTLNPALSGSFDVKTLRVGEITQWYPQHVRVSLYNEAKGIRQEITLNKSVVAIVENPFYTVMNQPNSTLQRLIRKLALLDSVDEASSSGKLDLIVQLPYVIKSDSRRQQAEQRRVDIEDQLKGSKYGIAYTDGTEKIIQLNRPAENNLLTQITTLRDQLYSELGLTPEVMNGTADEAAMINYNNRTVEPIVAAIVEALRRSFLTKTARTQGQTIDYFRDPFKLVPMSQMADLADKFNRNEIFTSNEIRQFLGIKPSKDPKADQLVNSNMPQADTGVPPAVDADSGEPVVADTPEPEDMDTGPLDDVNNTLTQVFNDLDIPTGPAINLAPPPGVGALDNDLLLQSLDDIDKQIDDMFEGLLPDEGGAE